MVDFVQVIVTWIDSIKIDSECLEPVNFLIIILILVTGGGGLVTILHISLKERELI